MSYYVYNLSKAERKNDMQCLDVQVLRVRLKIKLNINDHNDIKRKVMQSKKLIWCVLLMKLESVNDIKVLRTGISEIGNYSKCTEHYKIENCCSNPTTYLRKAVL